MSTVSIRLKFTLHAGLKKPVVVIKTGSSLAGVQRLRQWTKDQVEERSKEGEGEGPVDRENVKKIKWVRDRQISIAVVVGRHTDGCSIHSCTQKNDDRLREADRQTDRQTDRQAMRDRYTD